MNAKAVEWAFDCSLLPTSKVVLVALAFSADRSGRCWLAIKDLAQMTGLSQRAVSKSLKDLASRNLITRTHRISPDGGNISNIYQLSYVRSPKSEVRNG